MPYVPPRILNENFNKYLKKRKELLMLREEINLQSVSMSKLKITLKQQTAQETSTRHIHSLLFSLDHDLLFVDKDGKQCFQDLRTFIQLDHNGFIWVSDKIRAIEKIRSDQELLNSGEINKIKRMHKLPGFQFIGSEKNLEKLINIIYFMQKTYIDNI